MSNPAERLHAFADGTYMVECTALASTQDEARRRFLAGETRLIAVRADFQNAGRGRRGARWLAGDGLDLLVTYILNGPPCSPSGSGQLSLGMGVAVADAVTDLTGTVARVKWPNDVLLGNRKVAGVLVEAFRANLTAGVERWAAAVGIGLNVNTVRFPASLEATATSLKAQTTRSFALSTVEDAVRRRVMGVFADLMAGQVARVYERWTALDATQGTRYLAWEGSAMCVGQAIRVTPRGALRIRTENGNEIEVIHATSVAGPHEHPHR